MASILELYAGAEKELGLDKLAPNSAVKGTPYSIDDTKDPDGKVLTPAKLKTGYNMGDLGGGSKYAGGYTGDKGKNYSSIVKRDK